MTKKLWILIGAIAVILAAVLVLRFTPDGASIVMRLSGNATWFLPLVIVTALVDSVQPCAFSVLLITIAFLFNLGRTRADIAKVGAAYIVGIFLVYVGIGLGILQALELLGTPNVMAKVGASILIVIGGIEIAGEFFPSFPIRLRIPRATHRLVATYMSKASLAAALALGAFVGLFEFPCAGGPYLFILGLLHDGATFWLGLGYLVLYNVIFVLPLIIILMVASDTVLLAKVNAWKKENNVRMRLWGGVAMVALGVLIFLF
jgi:cytochrome c biogenesis protein CcdA